MAKRDKIWARVERKRLRLILGGSCYRCHSTENLEFDCITPQGDEHHRMDTARRVSFYRKQLAKNNLQLLCSKCHNKKSSTEQPDEPF